MEKKIPELLSRFDFEELVIEAIDSLPQEFLDRLENVDIIVESVPTKAQLLQQGVPEDGLLLGLYEGIALTRRSPMSYSGVMPDRITIFRRPHLRITSDEEQLRRRIAVTVVHEIGHHFGISDARLSELGWA